MKKNLFFLFIALSVFTSCQKEEAPVNPQNQTTPEVREINVDYTVYAASGNVELIILTPVNGVMVEKNITVNRMNETITFKTKSQQKLMIKARNTNPSTEEVMVAIYVDGILFKSNTTTTANAWAMATGSPL